MKKFILAAFVAVAVVALSSCSISRTTASQGNVGVGIGAAVISDLDVSNQKISYTYNPPKAVRRGGTRNCVNAAISEALAHNGGGDVLIETQEATIQKIGFFGKKIKSVTVTGYPAKYRNFRSADEQTVKQGIISGSLVRHSVKKEP